MNTIPRAKEKGAKEFDPVLRRKGSDPLLLAVKGRLQSRRGKINERISKELRLREGAENLFKATTNTKLRESVALELSFVNTNLQVLKEELADISNPTNVFDSRDDGVPMIPLGLKETNDVDVSVPFLKYIKEHYYEDCQQYQDHVHSLHQLRQACRTPVRNEVGIELLFEYYNQLYFIEKRFFPNSKNLGINFEWYDSLTGVPNCQKAVGFEKGSVLFNVAALYTELGVRQDRGTVEAIDHAIEYFERAAGTFKYLHSNFNHAPSMDMQPHTLTMFIQLMLAQGQECVLEKKLLAGIPDSMELHLVAAHEAAMVAEMYETTHKLMTVRQMGDYVPHSWVTMVQVKAQYFQALANYYSGMGIFDQSDSGDIDKLGCLLSELHIVGASSVTPPESLDGRRLLAKAYLRQALICHEEALRLHNETKQMRHIDTFQAVLHRAHDSSLRAFSQVEDEDDFSEVPVVPDIRPETLEPTGIILPDFSRHKVVDLFHGLGPLAIFSAKHEWSPPRQVDLVKGDGQEFGFSVRGDCPVIVAMVEGGSLAEDSGMLVGDFITVVGGEDVKWSKHDEVVALIRSAGNELCMTLITPMDRNYLEAGSSSSPPASPTMAETNTSHSRGSSTEGADVSPRRQKSRGSWKLRRKSKSDKSIEREKPKEKRKEKSEKPSRNKSKTITPQQSPEMKGR